jgi:[acyl-carrier-protein] S-malonyltransferase
MASGLYGPVERFTAVMDTAFDLLGADGERLRHEWLSGDSPDLDDVTRAQPLLYAVDCALGSTLIEWGVEPAVLIGHSVGEMAAATLAGVFSFSDGVRLMRDRMENFARTPAGGMLAVAASPDDVSGYLEGQLGLAAVNTGRQVLLAGPYDELRAVRRRLEEDGYTCLAVKARQAFHSPAVHEAAAHSVEAWRSVDLRPATRAVQSAFRPGPLTDALATDPDFWAWQPARTVWFWPALDQVLRSGAFLLVEVGPGGGLSTVARTHPEVRSGRSQVVATAPARIGGGTGDLETFLEVVHRIAAEGYELAPAGSVA